MPPSATTGRRVWRASAANPSGPSSRASGWLRRHQRTIQVVGGVMLVVVGVLLLTGVWEDLNRWLQAELVSTFQVPL